jgi:hypothetical protein
MCVCGLCANKLADAVPTYVVAILAGLFLQGPLITPDKVSTGVV